MKILSWNIRQGGGSRIPAILTMLKKENPDIICLNEWHNNKSGLQLQIALLRMGYTYQVVSAAKSNDNTAFICSKYPCSSELYKGIDDNYDANVVTASYDAFDVHSVYFPHKKKHQLFDLFENWKTRDRPQIIVGDYNTGINGIDQKGNSFWYQDEFINLSQLGFVDAFRYSNEDIQEYSWYSHQGNGFRYDQNFVSQSLIPVVQDCKYLHQYREEKISDHSPMLLTLGSN